MLFFMSVLDCFFFLLHLCLHAFNTRETTTLLDRKFKKDCSFFIFLTKTVFFLFYQAKRHLRSIKSVQLTKANLVSMFVFISL